MDIRLLKTKPTIEVQDGNNLFKISFTSVDRNFFVSSSENSCALNFRKNTKCFLNSKEDQINIVFEKSIPYIQFVSLSIDFDSVIEIQDNKLIFSLAEDNYVLDFKLTKFKYENGNSIILVLDEPNLGISINKFDSFVSTFSSKDFVAMTAPTSFLVDQSSKMPEFSVGIFDDALFSIPRPVRQGNPVISTVPALIDSNSTTDEIDYYNTGLGPTSKTIYFRIICNTIVEPNLSSGVLSPNLQLKIYLPNGLDTVKSAIYVDMYLEANGTENSFYTSSYTFYKQGRYNQIDYVDGFMYFDVHCPLTVQTSIPFQFDFTIL